MSAETERPMNDQRSDAEVFDDWIGSQPSSTGERPDLSEGSEEAVTGTVDMELQARVHHGTEDVARVEPAGTGQDGAAETGIRLEEAASSREGPRQLDAPGRDTDAPVARGRGGNEADGPVDADGPLRAEISGVPPAVPEASPLPAVEPPDAGTDGTVSATAGSGAASAADASAAAPAETTHAGPPPLAADDRGAFPEAPAGDTEVADTSAAEPEGVSDVRCSDGPGAPAEPPVTSEPDPGPDPSDPGETIDPAPSEPPANEAPAGLTLSAPPSPRTPRARSSAPSPPPIPTATP